MPDDSTIRKTMAARLIAAREAAGWRSRKAAASHFGFNVNTCKSHEYAIRAFNRDDAARYASAYHSTVPHLMADDVRTTLDPGGTYHDEEPTHVPSFENDVKPMLSFPKAREEDHSIADGTQRVMPSVGNVPHGVPHAQPSRSQAPPPQDPAGDARPAETPSTRLDGSTPATAQVVGILAHGLWVADNGPKLHDPAVEVPAAPDDRPQYARLVVAADKNGDLAPGDFVIFARDGGPRAPKGRVDLRRRKGRLSESAIWNSDGRRLTSDSATLEQQETIEFDPDDDSVVIEGVAIAVFRRL